MDPQRKFPRDCVEVAIRPFRKIRSRALYSRPFFTSMTQSSSESFRQPVSHGLFDLASSIRLLLEAPLLYKKKCFAANLV
jgi:hypothetical protein